VKVIVKSEGPALDEIVRKTGCWGFSSLGTDTWSKDPAFEETSSEFLKTGGQAEASSITEEGGFPEKK